MDTQKISLKKINKEHKKKMETWRNILKLSDELDKLIKLEKEIQELAERIRKDD